MVEALAVVLHEDEHNSDLRPERGRRHRAGCARTQNPLHGLGDIWTHLHSCIQGIPLKFNVT